MDSNIAYGFYFGLGFVFANAVAKAFLIVASALMRHLTGEEPNE